MSKVIPLTAPLCSHWRHGRCTLVLWDQVKKLGKPGLAPFVCRLWRAKLARIDRYWQARERTDRFGLAGEERQQAIDRMLARMDEEEAGCPDFRQDADSEAVRCRYFYMETCLLKLPKCTGACDRYLARGDQHSLE